MPELLFTCGTLSPATPEDAARGGWVADEIRGRLFDPDPYPARVRVDDPPAGRVSGDVREFEVTELEGPKVNSRRSDKLD